ncbi:MAG TPA: bifunctional 3-hydroxydecanoyl-ACP dehydratase/trans-2-decenoyl-ACP isomerase [Myxococcota bacterium]|nr:bifunctional 3-hydroxydecanoyl-ACP dehydratase/trans-2-decenoyl-ACP isomerase [Myxococcota bacterium]
MKYAEFLARDRFEADELLAFAWGRLVEDAPPDLTSQLPAPPMLMVDRIGEIRRDGRQGRIVAERAVRLDDWFFQCHFTRDPVQPGCLGVDAVWQLLGFFCVWSGALGSGRALGSGEIEFFGQIRPHDRVVRYEIDVRRYSELKATGSAIAIGDATVLVDDEPIYSIKAAKSGVFRGIAYTDYPSPGPNSRGGRLAP